MATARAARGCHTDKLQRFVTNIELPHSRSRQMAGWGNHRNSGRGRMTQDDLLDQENQQLAEQLSSKVSHLKSLAFDMEGDARDSNRYLDGMGDDFGSTQGLLSGSMTRMSNMIASGKNNRKLMCYIILFLVGLFILVYYVISRITAG